MANEPSMRWETLDNALLRDIYDSDQAMYPAPALSYDRLKSWVDACPELCLCLRSGDAGPGTDKTVHGSILVLPLRQPFWDRLRQAGISEHDVDAASMFPPGAGGGGGTVAVGLHVFHVERSPSFAEVWKQARFTVLTLEEVRGRVARLFASWDVVGYSALTATKQGSAAFQRLGFTPSGQGVGAGASLLSDKAEMMERRGNGGFTVAVSSSSVRSPLC